MEIIHLCDLHVYCVRILGYFIVKLEQLHLICSFGKGLAPNEKQIFTACEKIEGQALEGKRFVPRAYFLLNSLTANVFPDASFSVGYQRWQQVGIT